MAPPTMLSSPQQQQTQQQSPQQSSAAIAELFLEMQSKSTQWYDKEREGIALLEGFQTALNACRDELTGSSSSVVAATDSSALVNTNEVLAVALSGLGRNAQMDPLLAEDLFAQLQTLRSDFDALLQRMYVLHTQARSIVLAATSASASSSHASAAALAPIDYYQFMSHELAAYEAEFQHVEALLTMLTFDITTDELRTLVMSWSTSPFLNVEQSRAFRKRHDLAANV